MGELRGEFFAYKPCERSKMCGRYCLALVSTCASLKAGRQLTILKRPGQVRAYLENDDMPVWEAPEDDGDHAPRQSYNFAPGYHGIVYRADTPDWGAGPRHHKKGEGESAEQQQADDPQNEDDLDRQEPGRTLYKLQTMKWGLIPFWTKRNPDYGSMLKTINCRAESCEEERGMWNTMKKTKRCIVIAQGFYEWLKKGKDKVPHYIKRKDGKLMCFAGLWDCVQYEGCYSLHPLRYTLLTFSRLRREPVYVHYHHYVVKQATKLPS